MSDDTVKSIIAVFTAIVGVAIVSVIFSKNAQTGSVIQAIGTAFAQDLGVAVSPIAGGSGVNIGNTISGFTGLGTGLSSLQQLGIPSLNL